MFGLRDTCVLITGTDVSQDLDGSAASALSRWWLCALRPQLGRWTRCRATLSWPRLVACHSAMHVGALCLALMWPPAAMGWLQWAPAAPPPPPFPHPPPRPPASPPFTFFEYMYKMTIFDDGRCQGKIMLETKFQPVPSRTASSRESVSSACYPFPPGSLAGEYCDMTATPPRLMGAYYEDTNCKNSTRIDYRSFGGRGYVADGTHCIAWSATSSVIYHCQSQDEMLTGVRYEAVLYCIAFLALVACVYAAHAAWISYFRSDEVTALAHQPVP